MIPLLLTVGGSWQMNTIFESIEMYFEDEQHVKLKDIKDVFI